MRSRRAAISRLLLLLGLPGLPAAATSYVPMTDEALAAQAPLAAVVRIVEICGAGGLATEYTARAAFSRRVKPGSAPL